MRKYVALLVASLSLITCHRSSPTEFADRPLAFASVAQTSHSGFFEPRRQAVRGQDEWTRIWQGFHAGQSSVPELPAIDFARETVVLAAAGTQSSGCFGVEIEGVTLERNRRVEIDVVETVPGPNCVCTAALTQPAHLVSVGGVFTRAVFDERVRILEC